MLLIATPLPHPFNCRNIEHTKTQMKISISTFYSMSAIFCKYSPLNLKHWTFHLKFISVLCCCCNRSLLWLWYIFVVVVMNIYLRYWWECTAVLFSINVNIKNAVVQKVNTEPLLNCNVVVPALLVWPLTLSVKRTCVVKARHRASQ